MIDFNQLQQREAQKHMVTQQDSHKVYMRIYYTHLFWHVISLTEVQLQY